MSQRHPTMPDDHSTDDPDSGSVDAEAEADPDPDPGAPYTPNSAGGYAANASDLNARARIASRLGQEFGGDRDLYSVLGYDTDPDPEDYWSRFLRQDIAATIVKAPAHTSWRHAPKIQDAPDQEEETDFEADVMRLYEDHRLLHYLERVDVLAGLGRFGILFLGVADGEDVDLSDPVDMDALDGVGDLAYLSAFSERSVEVNDLVNDPKDPRFGLPESYEVEFRASERRSETVHWTRCIHIAEDLLEGEVYGRPRMEAVLNRLVDLEKVVGGAAEMTWRGADRKYVVNADPDMGAINNPEDMQEQFEDMIHGLRPAAYLRGMNIDSIEGDTVDPSGIKDSILELIAGETGIPKRILTGSERGELASTQDRATWLGRVSERQSSFCEPRILRPVLDRLVEFGILSPPIESDATETRRTATEDTGSYDVDWPDLFELNELEQADIRSTNAQALKNAAPSGDPGQLAEPEEIREQIMGWGPELGSESSIETVGGVLDELDYDESDPEAEDAFEDIMGGLPERDGDADGVVTVPDGGDDGGD